MDTQNYILQAVEGLNGQIAAHNGTWHLGEEEHWAADQDEGTISFSFADGTEAVAEMQIVGTYNTDDETFLWGWDHPSVDEELAKHAELAKAFGLKNELDQYSSRKVKCTEEDAWSFTAVAARLANANGAFCGRSGVAFVYMTFGEISLSKTKPEQSQGGPYCVLDDDDAEWFLTENFMESPSLRALEMPIEIVLESSEVIDGVDAIECVASCEILARLIGKSGPRTQRSQAIDDWVESFQDPIPNELIQSAKKAVDAILGPESELAETWAEDARGEQWRSAMKQLAERLQA